MSTKAVETNHVEHPSIPETKLHIEKVRNNLYKIMAKLARRAEVHDQSKLCSPEVEYFDKLTGTMKDVVYGSPEYKAALREIKPAIEHHYKNNSHHPEYYPDGIYGMSLLDLLEMLADWLAATERMKPGTGSLEASFTHNIPRFAISPDLEKILKNTARELGWLPTTNGQEHKSETPSA